MYQSCNTFAHNTVWSNLENDFESTSITVMKTQILIYKAGRMCLYRREVDICPWGNNLNTTIL